MSASVPFAYRMRAGDGHEFDVVDSATLERWVRESRVTPATLVWSAADNAWRAARDRRELEAAFASLRDANVPPVAGPPVNAMSVWSFVLAQLGLCCFPFAVPCIICGFVSLRQIRARGERGRGLAVSGIVLGFCGLALGALTLLYIWLVASLPPEVLQEMIAPELRPMLEPLLRPR
jgi:hypothetical protein